MTSCPKCSAGRGLIQGPTYEYESWSGLEYLRYRCRQCGYSVKTDTHDANKDKGKCPHGWPRMMACGSCGQGMTELREWVAKQ